MLCRCVEFVLCCDVLCGVVVAFVLFVVRVGWFVLLYCLGVVVMYVCVCDVMIWHGRRCVVWFGL